MYQLHHIAIYTNQFDECVKFYKAVFQCYPRGFFKMNGGDACMLHLNESTIIEIFQKDKEYPKGVFAHISISCDDVDALYERALHYGATTKQEPHDIMIGMEKPMPARLAFIYGPANEIIELFQEKEA